MNEGDSWAGCWTHKERSNLHDNRFFSPPLRALLALRSASPPPLKRCVCLRSPAPVAFAPRSGILGAGLFSSFPFLSWLTIG